MGKWLGGPGSDCCSHTLLIYLIRDSNLDSFSATTSKNTMRIEQMNEEQRLIWEGYDPKKVKDALTTSAGAFRDIDASALLQDTHKARKQKNRA